MSARVLGWALAVWALALPARAQEVSVNYNHSQDFTQFHTYAWGSNNANRIQNSILAQVVMQDIDMALQGRGLRKVREDQDPDLILLASGALRQETSYSAWGMKGIGGGMGGITPEQNVEGTLIVDLYSAKDRSLVWRGIAQNALSNNGNKNDPNAVSKSVQKMFKQLPPPSETSRPTSPPRGPPPSTPAPPPFPWPPPMASAEKVLPASVLTSGSPKTLGDVDHILSTAFEQTGYVERSYFSVPGGFALVARLEQIYSDGSSKPSPGRFSRDPELVGRFSLLDYLRALFMADPGHYRLIVFIVSSKPFPQSETPPSSSEATSWLGKGDNVLGHPIADEPLGPDTNCTALIYEFVNSGKTTASDQRLLIPSHLDAKTHLVKSGLWIALHLN